MARPAPAELHAPEPHGEAARSPRIDEVTATFPYDRRLAQPGSPDVVADRSADQDALLAFDAEHGSKSAALLGWLTSVRFSAATGLIAFAVAGLTVAGVIYLRTRTRVVASPAPAVATGTATINSRPDGARVVIDGVARGITPLKLSLSAGQHSLELNNGGETRTIPLTIENGTIVSQYVDLAPGPPASAEQLEISSDPSGAQVLVDGKERGVTPLIVPSIGPGQHEVVISNGDARVKRLVTVEKGATATVVASLTPAGGSAGWISIKAPIELQIMEGGRVIGTTGADQIMLPAGRHVLELVNTAFAFWTTVAVQVAPGKTARPAVGLPNGSLSINASPWADVWVDGQSLGTTPLANVSVPIGNHEVIWRHPQLGERRQTVAVTTKAPVRVGVELNK
jgi:hypothetical protein